MDVRIAISYAYKMLCALLLQPWALGKDSKFKTSWEIALSTKMGSEMLALFNNFE